MSERKWTRWLATGIRKMPWTMRIAHVFIMLAQPKYSVGVVGVILNDENHVLLVEHVFHAKEPWGLPGGWINRKENPADAMCRELREELALTVDIEALLLAEITVHRHLNMAYLCQQTGPIGKLSMELLDYGWFEPRCVTGLTAFHQRAIQQALEIKRAK